MSIEPQSLVWKYLLQINNGSWPYVQSVSIWDNQYLLFAGSTGWWCWC